VTLTYRIMTVCTGNICRSPLAEYALREAVAQSDLAGQVEITSAGTTGWESGNPIDPRAGALLRERGIDPADHRARRMDRQELEQADLVLALDHDHVGPIREELGAERAERTLRMVRDFAPEPVEDTGIRDPWYGDERDFELAWEQITEAVDGILEHVRSERRQGQDARGGARR
jgi:protein-tyrosine phosphatase